MPSSLPVSAKVVSIAFDVIQSLFQGLVRRPALATVRADQPDVWALYQMSRGRDSVSPAVLRKLAEAASK